MKYKKSASFLITMVVVIWIVQVINYLLAYQLNQYGIYPRQLESLPGVLLAPFLHGSFVHISSNTGIYLILGGLAALSGYQRLRFLTLFVIVVGGLLVWWFGRSNYHVGLSGVIFGYWGYVVFNGFAEKSFKAITVSVIAIFFYGGMFFGLLPLESRISFESHLFGAIAGLLYCYISRRTRKRKR